MAKVKRGIIRIDEAKCNGCGACVPSCAEGALKIVDTPNGPKARLVKENFCDGLGACLGDCPQKALSVVEEVVDSYDETSVLEHIKKTAPGKVENHIKHLKAHEAELKGSHPNDSSECPGSRAMAWGEESKKAKPCECDNLPAGTSQLRQWPVQLMLLNPAAAYFQDADLVIAADCVPFAYADFHREFLKGKALAIGCPKLDDTEIYLEKITEIFKVSGIKSVTVVTMEVPCCSGLNSIVKEAIKLSKKRIPYCETVIGIKGDIK